ncbi:bifunctional RNase H/acid phosphatase [Asanoa sp. WMMD1127]|uniref:bifunctional RNase H/acid phosphatase n=1 Tax=Asanoa sp. WMMD1127 TaxID=3016107 RepID=UPI002417936E|nr:bifunctional RNase H/acid phosphatase [Asanoa sp. WMMD1127]MDG4827271.1 bifunctional RNase H/acid phosphatase [Asanoa sp. WMMD1127]
MEADGGARGNPGPAGYGAVVRSVSGDVLAERSEALGITTNNVAEYRGLIAGLQAAVDLGAAEVDVRMDSKLVVEQMSGRWQIKNAGLRPLAAEAASLVSRFDRVSFTWIPRDRNTHADALANAAMDAAAGIAPVSSAAPAAASAPRSWEPRPLSGATRLLLVRHGATALTAQGRYSGRGDVPLSTVGEAQATAAGVVVAARAPDAVAVVSSPLSRCVATAEAIARELGGGVPVRVDDDLIECDFGSWEGLTFAEVRSRWAAELDAWLADPSVAPPDGESFTAVATRARRAVAALQSAYPSSAVVVVSHVSPLKLILRDALAGGDGFLHRLYLDPAGLSTVDYWPDGGVAVRTVNDTSHLR